MLALLPALYVVLFAGSLWRSYGAEAAKLNGFAERDYLAGRCLWSVLDSSAEGLSTVPLVRAANRLHVRLSQSARDYGPSTWDVRWRYGLVPEFDAGRRAEVMLALVQIPPTVVYAQNRYMIQIPQYRAFAETYPERFFYYYRTLEMFLYGLNTDVEAAQGSCVELLDAVDVRHENPSDPRSTTSRLIRRTTAWLPRLPRWMRCTVSRRPRWIRRRR